MADKTFGVKVNEDLHEKVQAMIENSPLTAKEWFEKAVSLVETNSIKEGSLDYQQDLSELEIHSTRIFELVANMINRSIYLKESAIKGLSDKVEQKEMIISEYQLKVKEANEERSKANDIASELQQEKEVLLKQVEEVRYTNENNQALILEYKEKIDSLSGLISKYQSFADENEQLKEQFRMEREALQSQLQEATVHLTNQNVELQELKRTVENLQLAHEREQERTIEKKDYEKDRALLEMEKDFQGKLSVIYQEHHTEIKKLYDDVATMRKEYEKKLESISEEKRREKNKDKDKDK